MRTPPPTRAEWAIEGELVGHSVEETVRYSSDCADWEDAHPQRRAVPVGVVLADGEPKLVTRLRRLFGRW
jgi:hypothetical protein